MNNLLKTIFPALLIFILIVYTGCNGGKDVNKDSKNNKSSTDENITALNETGNDYPEWFLNQPKAEGAIYAVGVAKKQNPQLARDTAIARARNEIARVIKVKVTTMTKDFLEESGVGNSSKSLEFTQIVTKQISDNVISGSQVDKIKIDKTTTPNTYYVLVKLDLKDLSKALDEITKYNSADYSKLSANKAFEELTEELKKLRPSDIEEPKIITDEDK